MRLLVAGIYPPDVGGPATYAVLMEQELPNRGIEVAIAPFGAVRHLPPLIRHAAYFWRLYRGMQQADVLFVQDTVSCGLPALCAAWLARKPLVIRVPGDYAWEQGVQRFEVADSIDAFQNKRYGLRIETLRAMQSFVVRRADHVITPSNYFSGVVKGWGISGDRLTTIYNGIDTSARPASIEKPHGLVAVSIGRLVPWKGFGTLIEVIARLPEWKLVIVGDGPERTVLENKIQALGLSERVSVAGTVSRAEVLGWCAAADAFVLNSSFESFSFQTVEAMMSRTPIIATRIGSLPELIDSPTEGMLLPIDDQDAFVQALKSIEGDPSGWERRVEAAYRKSQQFSVGFTMDALARLLETV